MERECSYCDDFHEPPACRKCGRFVRCAPDSEQGEKVTEDEATAGGMVMRVTYQVFSYTCRGCGNVEQRWSQASGEARGDG